MKTSGIYRLQFPTGHYYIGSSRDHVTRCRHHQNSMLRGKHDSQRIQNVYDKYGQLPVFGLIIACDMSELENNEQSYLDEHVGKILCLNISKCAESPRRGVKGKPCTEEHKKYMREKMRTRVFTDEHRKRISDSKKGFDMAATRTPEILAKRSADMKGRTFSQSHLDKISKSLMGHKPAFSKPVVLINTGQVFESGMLAERETGAAAVGRACRKGYTAGKMKNGEPMKWAFQTPINATTSLLNHFKEATCLNK